MKERFLGMENENRQRQSENLDKCSFFNDFLDLADELMRERLFPREWTTYVMDKSDGVVTLHDLVSLDSLTGIWTRCPDFFLPGLAWSCMIYMVTLCGN